MRISVKFKLQVKGLFEIKRERHVFNASYTNIANNSQHKYGKCFVKTLKKKKKPSILFNFFQCLLAQFVPGYPNNYNYNNNIYPTFSDLNTNIYTTPLPYVYNNPYANPYTNPYQQVASGKIRIWPFVIDQYQYQQDQYVPYYNYSNYNNLNNILYPTLQTWYQQPIGKKK